LSMALTFQRIVPHALRLLALLIAVAAIVDPAIRSSRRTRPLLSLVVADTSRDTDLVDRVTRALEREYTLVSAPLPAAVGTVLIGARLPDNSDALATPVVVVSPAGGGPSVSMRRIQSPTRVMLESRVVVSVTLAVTEGSASEATPRSVGIELTQDGVVVAREQRRIARDTVLTVPLTFVPSSLGDQVLQARAFVSERPDTVRHDILVSVRANRWSVLFFDRRPSWMSTFVRRALERDSRFAVTSRVITSTNISRQQGRPPVGLDVIASAEAFDAVVIGAPDALLARDVDGIGTLLRTRGASVLILADHAASGPADVLLDFGGWRNVARRVPAELSAPTTRDRVRDPLRLKGMAFGVPRRLADHVVPLAVLRDATTDSARTDTVIWRVPIGLGQLVVSGAFDAWRYRDTAQSTFDATWRDFVDEAASQRLAPLEVRVTPALMEPRATISLVVTPRDSAVAAPIRVMVHALASPTEAPTPLILDTIRATGQLMASFRAPARPGNFLALVVQGSDTVRAPLVVASRVATDATNDPDLLASWASSRGGRVVSRDSIESLSSTLNALLHPVPQIVEWHPMRSPWWIIPFAVALAAEWWIRRRRGLA
ncbi:MAG: hypothetical protein ABMA00_19105, partial [Gemmatimonas sp.]